MSHSKLLGMILLATTAWGQTTGGPGAVDAVHYPQIIHAEVPLYPPIARAAHITGTVEIQVTVEKGAVVKAQVKSVVLDPSDPMVLNNEGRKKVGLYLSNPSLANIKAWQFDSEDRRTFLVRYVYRIEGEATVLPESPKVELDFPLLVRITARPLKPTCMDCDPAVIPGR